MSSQNSTNVTDFKAPVIGVGRLKLSTGKLLILDENHHTLCIHPSAVRFDRLLERRVERFQTNPGFIGIVPAGTDCVVDVRSTSAEVIRVSMATNYLSDIANQAGAQLSSIMRDQHENDMTMLYLALAYLAESQFIHASTLSLETTANAMFSHLVARYAERPRSFGGVLSPRRLRLVTDYIEDNLDANITIAKMAMITGISTFHFSRLFAATTGLTPHRYVMLKRVARAVELLRGTSMGLAEIADSSGFADQSHLARWIRARYKTAPGRLRRETVHLLK